jgi:CBS domain
MSCNVRRLNYAEPNATRTACQSQQARSEEESGSIERRQVGEAWASSQLRGRRRHRQYQSRERGLLPRPAAVLIIMYRFVEGAADQYMTRAVTTVTRQTTMRELEALFEKHDFNSFPVVEKGKMLGIVTKFDFLRAFAFTIGQMVPHYDELMRRPVGEMMTDAGVQVIERIYLRFS